MDLDLYNRKEQDNMKYVEEPHAAFEIVPERLALP